MQNHCDLWYEINDEHCKRWKRGFDKQPAGLFNIYTHDKHDDFPNWDMVIFLFATFNYQKVYALAWANIGTSNVNMEYISTSYYLHKYGVLLIFC
jgi:hypothetical protein